MGRSGAAYRLNGQAADTSLTVCKVAVRLRGLIYDSHGRAMSPSDSRGRGGWVYRYYVSQAVLKGGATEQPATARLPASEIEAAVIAQVRAPLRQPEMVVGIWRAARSMAPDVTEQEVLLEQIGFESTVRRLLRR